MTMKRIHELAERALAEQCDDDNITRSYVWRMRGYLCMIAELAKGEMAEEEDPQLKLMEPDLDTAGTRD